MKLVQVIKRNKLLSVTIIIYFILFVTIPEKASSSVRNSLFYIKEMLQIMPVVFILTSIIEAWVPKDLIMKGFGANSGLKGNMLSLLLGSVSAGPIYAAFPVCKMLLRKGASITNAVIILSAWAVIKIPMLANEAKFLGARFMGIRWILTVLSILAMAYIIPVLVKKESIPLHKEIANSESKTVVIKELYCVGCGLCAKLMPEHFEINERKARLKRVKAEDSALENFSQIILKCPVKAISLKQDLG
jgi:uncharacterized membrane protein YraQ (UPF0718 family)